MMRKKTYWQRKD